MPAAKFRTAYDFDFGDRSDLDFSDDPVMTVQDAKDECDINLIIARANQGIGAPLNERIPTFGDFSEVGDFQELQNAVIKAQNEFGALPSAVRNRFDNSPAKLLEFLANEENREEAVKLGLIPEPVVVPVGDGKPAQPAGNGSEVVPPPKAA